MLDRNPLSRGYVANPALLRWLLAGALALLLVLALAAVALRWSGQPSAVEVRLPEAPASDGVLKVYISGAVARPGIYQLRAGDRYADALAVAGGPAEDADTAAINLARRARDEDHIHVPRAGETITTRGVAATVVDLNSATREQLESLPGIGPTRAQRIIESRAKDGAFRSVDDLAQRKLLPASQLEALRETLQVRQ